jgi:hypothetical protein
VVCGRLGDPPGHHHLRGHPAQAAGGGAVITRVLQTRLGGGAMIAGHLHPHRGLEGVAIVLTGVRQPRPDPWDLFLVECMCVSSTCAYSSRVVTCFQD